MTCPDPPGSRTPTSTMMHGRSPRIRLPFTTWTLLLIGLVLLEIRYLPPGLTALLVPYLAVMAWHCIDPLREGVRSEPAMPLIESVGSPSDDEPEGPVGATAPYDPSGSSDSPDAVPPHPPVEKAMAASRRGRAKRRPKTPEAGPSATGWVQVRPGRFVRVGDPSPEHPAVESNISRPDEPHGSLATHAPGAPPETGSTPAGGESDVAGSAPVASPVEPAATEAIVLEEGEMGQEPIAVSPATSAPSIGRPSGDLEGQIDSFAT
jgi:hypothetical protein